VRAYIPATLSTLASCLDGTWAPTEGYAVTERLMEVSSHEDSDLLDEQARDAAALASVTDLHAPRRVVIVADLSRSQVHPAPHRHPAAVDLGDAVPADAVVCAFVDEPEAAVDAKVAAAGDAGALDRLYERDLLWYDVGEFARVESGEA
jgi:hypothetical protein